MPKADLWSKSVPRAGLDQRARDARLRLERVERLLAPRVRETGSWLRRLLCRCGLGLRGRRQPARLFGRAPRTYRISGEFGGSTRRATGHAHAAIGLAGLS